jgi:hypothetical protein
VTERQLKREFEIYGEIVSLKMVTTRRRSMDAGSWWMWSAGGRWRDGGRGGWAVVWDRLGRAVLG